jgi:hypothetical protein
LLAEVAPGKNRLIYLWGHLIAVHDGMFPILGLGDRLHRELDAIFLTCADRTIPNLPSAADLERLWHAVHEPLMAGFSRFTAEDWVQKHAVVSAADFAVNPLRNRLAVLFSRTAHIAYHLGQAMLVAGSADAGARAGRARG